MNHKILTNVEHIITNLKPVGQARYLWCRAYHVDKSERVLIFRRQNDSVRQIADIWLSEQAVEQLTAYFEAAPGNLEAHCDAMYATAHKYLWVDDGEELLLWHKRSLVGRFNTQKIHLKRRFPRGWLYLPVSQIESCLGFLSYDLIKRGVAIHTHSGKQIVIASKRELGVIFDPTYAEIEMMFNTSWLYALARAIEQKTRVPLKLDEGLL